MATKTRTLRGIVSGELSVPRHIVRPAYAFPARFGFLQEKRPPTPPMTIATADDIAGMRVACRLAAQILEFGKNLVKPGVTTDEIDKAVHKEIVANGAYPSPLRYNGFPKSLCTSVNDVVLHGIPDSRPLAEGDIVNLDITVFIGGYHGDTSDTFPVGRVSDAATRLITVTREALQIGIKACAIGRPMSRIGDEIDAFARGKGYTVVADYIGHGIGKHFHTKPDVHHTPGGEKTRMREGMIFTIEPALCIGQASTRVLDDHWTVVTRDGSLSAQAEHTVLITEQGADVLTKV